MRSTSPSDPASPLICHVIYRLDYGGLENGLVNLINNLPEGRYRHVIVTLAGFSDYSKRLRPGVTVTTVEKKPGLDFGLYARLWKFFRRCRPDIVHTRNLATLESQLPAMLAGIRRRVHGEHGRDVHDVDNTRVRYRALRKLFSFIVQKYICVSRDLKDYLVSEIGIGESRVARICNGVDTEKYHPGDDARRAVLAEAPVDVGSRVVIGTIGRMQPIKDQLNLARAFIDLVQVRPGGSDRPFLVMVGDGPLREEAGKLLVAAGLENDFWLPGARPDTPEFFRAFDLFVLPSLGEGISNTILEAMASGLPCVATDTGGNAELVAEGETGFLVPTADSGALSAAIARYLDDEQLRKQHGLAARRRACEEFSLDSMVQQYDALYGAMTA